jgi:hypothetical protein
MRPLGFDLAMAYNLTIRLIDNAPRLKNQQKPQEHFYVRNMECGLAGWYRRTPPEVFP